LKNIPHLDSDTKILVPYLKNAIQEKISGVNILIHGKPGVGKSEYVQSLASQLGVDLFEIDFSDDDGNPIKGEARLRAYSLCQNMLARTHNAMLVFDEIEDVFPNNGAAFFRMLFGGKGGESDSSGKAWVNRTLERNPIPAIWVSNSVDQIDPAYLRRFDYSLKFSTPPKSVRHSIVVEHHLGSFNPPSGWLERIATNEELTPSQLDRAAKVARIVGSDNSIPAIKLIDQTLDRSASLLGQKRTASRNISKTGYNLEFLNTDANIPAIISGLKNRPRGSFCFFGNSGTGKSQLACHIADEIGKVIRNK
jgi:MoxR-like ATPase